MKRIYSLSLQYTRLTALFVMAVFISFSIVNYNQVQAKIPHMRLYTTETIIENIPPKPLNYHQSVFKSYDDKYIFHTSIQDAKTVYDYTDPSHKLGPLSAENPSPFSIFDDLLSAIMAGGISILAGLSLLLLFQPYLIYDRLVLTFRGI